MPCWLEVAPTRVSPTLIWLEIAPTLRASSAPWPRPSFMAALGSSTHPNTHPRQIRRHWRRSAGCSRAAREGGRSSFSQQASPDTATLPIYHGHFPIQRGHFPITHGHASFSTNRYDLTFGTLSARCSFQRGRHPNPPSTPLSSRVAPTLFKTLLNPSLNPLSTFKQVRFRVRHAECLAPPHRPACRQPGPRASPRAERVSRQRRLAECLAVRGAAIAGERRGRLCGRRCWQPAGAGGVVQRPRVY